MARKWVAAAVGGVAGALGMAMADPPAKEAAKPAAVQPAQPADPLGGMLTEAKTAYTKVRDYACTVTRQERVGGVLGAEQVGALKVRVKPYSVHVRFAKPEAAAGLEATYVAGGRTGKVRLRPAGAKGVSTVLQVSPDDPKATADGRRPLTDLGFGPVLDRLATAAAREKALGNPVEVFTGAYTFAGRPVTRYEVFARRPHAHRDAYRTLVFVDDATKLPVRVEAYDAPKPGQTAGDLLEAYSFSEVKLNVGLGDSAFGE